MIQAKTLQKTNRNLLKYLLPVLFIVCLAIGVGIFFIVKSCCSHSKSSTLNKNSTPSLSSQRSSHSVKSQQPSELTKPQQPSVLKKPQQPSVPKESQKPSDFIKPQQPSKFIKPQQPNVLTKPKRHSKSTKSQSPLISSSQQNSPDAWENLRIFLKNNEPYQLGRLPAVERNYKKYQKNGHHKKNAVDKLLGRSGSTAEECFFLKKFNYNGKEYMVYIQYTKLKLNTYQNWLQKFDSSHDHSIKAKSADLVNTSNNILMLTRNIFPYNIDSSIDHWLLWSSDLYLDIKAAEIAVKDVLKDSDIILKANPGYARSIPQVLHFHIFTRDKT